MSIKCCNVVMNIEQTMPSGASVTELNELISLLEFKMGYKN